MAANEALKCQMQRPARLVCESQMQAVTMAENEALKCQMQRPDRLVCESQMQAVTMAENECSDVRLCESNGRANENPTFGRKVRKK